MIVVCFAALVWSMEASSATSCASASEVEATATQMGGNALLQLKGAVKKVDASPPGAAVADIDKSAQPQVALAERSNTSGVIAKKPDEFSFNSNNNNNNNDLDLNNNDDKKGKGGNKDRKPAGKKKDDKKHKSSDAFDFNNNNNNNDNDNDKDTCKDMMCPQDVCPDGKGRRQVGKDCCSCKEAKPEMAVDNFDFGEGKLKDDKNAAVDSLKATVKEAVSKVSSSLDEAATHEKAIRKSLDTMSTANEQETKKIVEELENRLGEAEDSVHDAQKELRKLNREAQLKLKYSSQKSAASSDILHRAWFVTCACLSLFSLLL